jgi:hypothetical protein
MHVVQEVTKDCQSDACRIEFGAGTSTLVGWTPIYDKSGNRVNEDPNAFVQEVSCQTCGKKWSVSTVLGATEVHLATEVKP